jgi:hypothetical protein
MENYAEHDGEGIAGFRGCFALREGGFIGFLDVHCWFLTTCRYDKRLTTPDRPSLPSHRQGVFPPNL